MIGPGHSLDEELQFIDFHFCIQKQTTVPLVVNGEWCISREAYNDRGDEGTIQKRMNSIMISGFRTDLRGSSFLIETEDQNKRDASHWASLLQGAERLWRAQPGHVGLKNVLATGIPAKVYRKETPAYARVWLKDYGNLLSDNTTMTTPLEVWRSSLRVGASFDQQKMQWVGRMHRLVSRS